MLPAKTSTPTGQPSALHSKAITICFVTPLAIAIVAEGNDVALGVGSFKVAAGNVVEHQVTILEMTSRQSALNGALAFQEPVHRQVTMEIHIDFAFHAGQFPQSGVGFCVSKRRRLTKLSVC